MFTYWKEIIICLETIVIGYLLVNTYRMRKKLHKAQKSLFHMVQKTDKTA